MKEISNGLKHITKIIRKLLKRKKKIYGENNKEIIKARNKINREKQKIIKQNDKLQ